MSLFAILRLSPNNLGLVRHSKFRYPEIDNSSEVFPWLTLFRLTVPIESGPNRLG